MTQSSYLIVYVECQALPLRLFLHVLWTLMMNCCKLLFVVMPGTTSERTTHLFTSWLPWLWLPSIFIHFFPQNSITLCLCVTVKQVFQGQEEFEQCLLWPLSHWSQLFPRIEAVFGLFLYLHVFSGFFCPTWVLVSIFLSSWLGTLMMPVTFCQLPNSRDLGAQIRPLLVCLVNVFLFSIHIYKVIVHFVVLENPKDQGNFDWFKGSNFHMK